MATAQIDAMKELQDSFQLLFKNWMLALPTAIASLLATLLMVLVVGALIGGVVGAGVLGGGANGQGSAAAATALLGGAGIMALVGGIVVVLVSLGAHATVVFAAADVWAGKPVDLGSAMSRAFPKLGQLILAAILIFLLAIIPGILVFLFIGVLLLIALGFFMMYVTPGVTVGDKGAMDAIKESFNLAKNNFAPSAIAFVGVVVVALVGAIINSIFLHWFVLNFIVGFVVGGLTSAYAAIVVVRFYQLLTRSARLAPAAAPPAPTAPTA